MRATETRLAKQPACDAAVIRDAIRSRGSVKPASDRLDVPLWWLGSRERFKSIHAARSALHEHDRISGNQGLNMLVVFVISVVSISAHAAFAASANPGWSGVLSISMLLLLMTIVWAIDRRLIQQLRGAKKRAFVWNELTAAVSGGCVDLSRAEGRQPAESEVEKLLREELKLVLQYLAANEKPDLHLSIFNDRIRLSKP